jgi:antitoxin component of MazEF toxin-antitoxin module
MKTRIVRIGGSPGVPIPRPLTEQANLPDEVELRVGADHTVIAPAWAPRAGWATAATVARAAGADDPLEAPVVPTPFDESGWRW